MCKNKTEVYSRIVGYYRPVQQWNRGMQEQFLLRVPYAVSAKHSRNYANAQATLAARRAALRASQSAIAGEYGAPPQQEVMP